MNGTLSTVLLSWLRTLVPPTEDQPDAEVGGGVARARLSGSDRLLRRTPGEWPLPQVITLSKALLSVSSADPPVQLDPVLWTGG